MNDQVAVAFDIWLHNKTNTRLILQLAEEKLNNNYKLAIEVLMNAEFTTDEIKKIKSCGYYDAVIESWREGPQYEPDGTEIKYPFLKKSLDI